MVAFMAGRSAALAGTFPEDCQPVMTPPCSEDTIASASAPTLRCVRDGRQSRDYSRWASVPYHKGGSRYRRCAGQWVRSFRPDFQPGHDKSSARSDWESRAGFGMAAPSFCKAGSKFPCVFLTASNRGRGPFPRHPEYCQIWYY
jgi:hypothetical protein